MLLTLLAPYVCLLAVLIRLIAQGWWAAFVALIGFALAALGSLDSLSDAGVIGPTPGASVTPMVGLWLFAAAAAVGVIASTADLIFRPRPGKRRPEHHG